MTLGEHVKQATKTLRTIADLAEAGLVPVGEAQALEHVAQRYPAAITPELLALIDPANAADPIARQFVPDARELEQRPEELPDPIGDERFAPVPGWCTATQTACS